VNAMELDIDPEGVQLSWAGPARIAPATSIMSDGLGTCHGPGSSLTMVVVLRDPSMPRISTESQDSGVLSILAVRLGTPG
jgi:hypothetical protein